MSSWAFIGPLLRRHRRALVHVVLWSVVDGLPAFASGGLVALALDHGFLRNDIPVGLAWLGGLGVAAGVRAIAARRMFPWLGAIVEPLRDELFEAVVTTTLQRAIAGEATDLASVSRLTGQVEAVRSLVAAAMRTLRQIAVTVFASLAGLLVLAPAAAAICSIPVLAALVLYAALLGPLSRRQYGLLLAEERIAADAGRGLVALRDVVACGAQARVAAEVGTEIDARAAAGLTFARASALRRLVVLVGGEAPVVLLLGTSPWLIRHAGMTVGDLAGAATYVALNLLPAMRSLVGTVGTWGLQLAVVFRRLAEAAVPVAVEEWRADPVTVQEWGADQVSASGSYALQLRGASFAYGPHSEPIVRDFDLLVPQGDHIAIVGPSGIGKSTLTELMSGGTRPTSGDVLLGEIPLPLLDPVAVRREITLLPQQAYVFAGSLRENLTYLRPDCLDSDLDRAVDKLGVRALVDRLGGYEGQVAGLSEGERQLIAVARVWLSAARVVILDEATSHLDLATEARVEQAFVQRGGTLIVVAHRMSSARRARRVLLMEDGRITSGSDHEQAGASELYATMRGHWQAGAVADRPLTSVS